MAGAGLEFFSAVLLGTLGGWLLDYLLGTKPWMVISGVGIGFATGLFLLVKMRDQSSKD